MTNVWTVEKLKALYTIIQGLKAKFGMTNIPFELVLKEVRKDEMFILNADAGIERAMNRLSNANASTEWPSDTRSRMMKYYEAIGMVVGEEIAVNKQRDESVANAKRSYRSVGQNVQVTGNYFPDETAMHDGLNRAKAHFAKMVNSLNDEVELLSDADQLELGKFMQSYAQ